jgi:hypothetical protein
MNLIEKLKKYNIRAKAYSKPPAGKDVFVISIKPDHPEGTILINQGNAKIQVRGDAAQRQAAITVREQGRVVTRKVTKGHYSRIEPGPQEQKRILINAFPTVMPSGTKWTVKDIKMNKVVQPPSSVATDSTNQPQTWRITGIVTARVIRRTVMHFLVGMDETHHFVSPLSKHARSVLHAHGMLRPLAAKRKMGKGAKRQGEWFFVKLTKEELAEVEKIAENQSRIQDRQLGKTTHRAKSAVRGKKGIIYAIGLIADTRRGRHEHLWLSTWHKVVRNKEAKMKASSEQREAAARRRKSFD